MGCWYDGPLVGLDFETTGVDPLTDLPVQVALVWCDGRGGRRSAVWLIDPGCTIPDAAIAVHGISSERARSEGRSLESTARILHRELAKAASEDVPIVAMNASFDVTIATSLFSRVELEVPRWDLVIDPLVIDRRVDKYRKGKRRLESLCEHYGICLEGAHDAGQDARAAVSLAREIGKCWPEAGRLDPEELTILQRVWHREWASDFNDWCEREGRPLLEPADYLWPVRRRTSLSDLEPAGVPAGAGGAAAADQSASESRTISMSSSVERGLTMASRMAVAP